VDGGILGREGNGSGVSLPTAGSPVGYLRLWAWYCEEADAGGVDEGARSCKSGGEGVRLLEETWVMAGEVAEGEMLVRYGNEVYRNASTSYRCRGRMTWMSYWAAATLEASIPKS